MGMEVVYIPSETTVKVLSGLSHSGLIGTQICNRNPVSWIDYVGGQVRSVVQSNDRVSGPKWGTRVVPMGMAVVYIPSETTVKVSTGLSNQELI